MSGFRTFRKNFKENSPEFIKELERLYYEKSYQELFRYYLFISEQLSQSKASSSNTLEALTNEISDSLSKNFSQLSFKGNSRRLVIFTRLYSDKIKNLVLAIDRKNFDPVLVVLNKSAESKILKNELTKLHIPCRLEEFKVDLLTQINFLQLIIEEEDAGSIICMDNQADIDLKVISRINKDNCINVNTDNSLSINKTINLQELKNHFWNSNEAIPDFRRASVFECWNDSQLPQELLDYSQTTEQLCLFTHKPLELFEGLPENYIYNFSFTSNPSEVETIMQSCKEVLANESNFENAISTARKYGCDLRNLTTRKKWLYEYLEEKFNANRKFKVELNDLRGKLSRKKRKTPRLIHFRHDHSAPIIRYISQDISNALQNLGIDLLDIDLSELHQANHLKNESAISEARKFIMKKIKQFKPDQALGYNAFGIFPSGESHLLEKLGIPYNGLFFDNPFYSKSMLNNTPNKDIVRLFTLDRELIPLLESCGFKNSHYLPIATSAQRFSMKQNSSIPHTQLLFTSTVKPKLSVSELANECSNIEDAEFIKFAHPRILQGGINFQKILQAFNTETKHKDYPKDFSSFIETWFKLDLQCTTHFRLKTVESLKEFNMNIYGGSFWNDYELSPKHTYMNFLDYKDLPLIARSADLTLCSTPVNIQDGIQQRVLDCGALQSPILTDYRPVLEEHFKLDEELYVYKSFEELKDKTEFLLNHPELRQKASLKLYENVMQNHTWERRMEEFLNMI